jgi:parallel beta-helix repeat protein
MPLSNPVKLLVVGFAVLCFPSGALAQSAVRPAVHHKTPHHRVHHPRRHVALKPKLAKVAVARTPSAPLVAITGTTHYVSPNGSDSNAGTSPAQAWKTVDQANRAHLQPGDGVLFQGGATFSDDTLMPGWGTAVSGTSIAPVVFGSYGQGKATLTAGIWTQNESYIVFQSLNLGPAQGVSGTGTNITIQDCSIKNIISNVNNVEFGIDTNGSHYTIRNNTIDHTGDSGMYLIGDHYLVRSNTITNTGLDAAVTWGAHGIYLKASDSTVTGNTITNFHNEGISVRYRDSTITNNTIANGQYGIAWHQYDTLTATSHWTGNTIRNTSIVAIYISPHDIGGSTHENFVITNNTLTKPSPVAGWIPMDLNTQSPVNRDGNTVR